MWEWKSQCSWVLWRAGAAPALYGWQSSEEKKGMCWGSTSPVPARAAGRTQQGPFAAATDRQLAVREITVRHGKPPLGSGEER